MYTYTTPTITCTLNEVDFTIVDYVRIAVKGKGTTVVKQIDVADIDDGKAIIKLTQEETARLGEGQISIQARIRYEDGTVSPTNKVTMQMNDVLDKVVI